MEAIRCGAKRSVQMEDSCHVTHNGKKLFIKTKCRPINLHSKVLLYCRFRDVTDKMRLQQEASFVENKLIYANRLTSLGALVSSVAHEINNPNNFIMLNSSLLHEPWVDAVRILEDYSGERSDVNLAGLPFVEMKGTVSKLIFGVMDGSRRINSIVDSLKGFSERSQKSSKGPINVNKVIQMAASILSSHIKNIPTGSILPWTKPFPRYLEMANSWGRW